MMETKVLNIEGKEIGKVTLNDIVFGNEPNKTLLWENMRIILANQRKGLAKAKSRAEVKGTGKKPWRQKGIGWARHGSQRAVIWRGGGVVFGPKPRDYSMDMPKKKKIKALAASLSICASENKIFILDDLKLDAPKTKLVSDILNNLKLKNSKTLIGVDAIEKNLKLASRNIPNVNLKRVSDINCYDVLEADFLVLTRKSLEKLEQRWTAKK